ncbi:putative receptor-like protein kinase At1g80870 [Lolium rigidum]|uniref:putative receptor-like protein kinase At1g80870 n=1 Tax=Lolium rigidum TaxID=89674 RepID=UPI001F5DD74C|nr:putative receptor-like protein kinase At1g80870 [Lolium rigidum]
MPSRLLQPLPPPTPPPPPPLPAKNHRHVLLAVTTAAATAGLLLLLLLLLVLHLRRRRRRLPTLPFSPPQAPARPLRRYSRRALRRATGGFHPSRLLGRGAASPVYLATFPDASLAAVKTCSSPHELHVLSSLPANSPRLVSLLGYSGSGSAADQPLLLVFEYLPQGSLQGALFSEGRFLDWTQRLAVVRDVACALAFLHAECQPPVVHGDLKPSNVLLDDDFRAKVADFGLARFKTPDAIAASGPAGDDFMSQELGEAGDLSTTASAVGLVKADAREDSGPARAWGKEWWWKQDGSGELDSRDYVAEWIGSQICPERNPDWADDNDGHANDHNKNSPSVTDDNAVPASPEDKKNADNADYSANKGNAGEKKEATQMREWWKEEFFEEMSKKGGSFDKRRRGTAKPWLRSISMNTSNVVRNVSGDGSVEPSALDMSFRRNRKRSRRRGQSAGSGDMHSGDLFSRDLSTTTSMRGTVCYVAPECGGGPCEHGSDLLEKADVYSFGVLVLVILSGRRPLHILSSPMKLEKANLVSWCRQLARTGNVLELLDERLEGAYDKDQATLCVQLALLCLQRQPEHRPDSTDIVKILAGEMELPPVPVEFSPSPRIRPFPRSSRRAQPDATE